MGDCEIDEIFKQLTDTVEEELAEQREKAKLEAFKAEARPIPDGLIWEGIPLGHITLRGDFEA